MTIRSSALILAAAAGCACSVANAEPTSAPHKAVHARLAGYAHRNVIDANQQDIYNNGIDPNITDGYFVSGDTDVVDDVYFNRGPGAGPGPGTAGSGKLLQQATISIGTITGVDPQAQVDARLQWYQTFTPGTGVGVPVITNLGGEITVTIDPPPEGWADNSVYFIDVDLTGLPGGGIQTTNEFGGVRYSLFDVGTTNPTFNFQVAWYGNGLILGYNSPTFWLDNDFNGIFSQDEGFIFTGAEQPRAALAMSLQATVDSGSCCLPDGSCILANSASCTRAGGVFGGNNTTCGTCAQPGACLLTAGACLLTNSSQCTTLTGTYKGNGTTCDTSVCRQGSNIVLWDNGPLATGATLTNGTAAPAGGNQWSESAGVTGCINNVNGFADSDAGPFRLSDDFVIPQGETWTITSIDTYAYLTGAPTTASPFTGLNLQIWNGLPFDVNSTVVAGDEFTSRLTSSTFSHIYRTVFNTNNATRPVWLNVYTFPSPVVLGPGHYYVDWQSSTGGTAHFAPPTTTKGFRGTPLRNALQGIPTTTGNTWTHMEEQGLPIDCGAGVFGVEFPFRVHGTSAGAVGCGGTTGCYANCDHSTNLPILNVNDFICFQTAFAAGQSYANCDNSTQPPVLNVNDFICFQAAFANGCTAP